MLVARQQQLPAQTPAGLRAPHAPSPLLLTPTSRDELLPAQAEELSGPGAVLGARGMPAPTAGPPGAAGMCACCHEPGAGVLGQ